MGRLMAPGEVLLDAIYVGLVNDSGSAEPAAALGLFPLQQVALAGMGAHDFASARDFESFGH